MSRDLKRLILEISVGILCYVLVFSLLVWLFHGRLGFELWPALLGLAAGFLSDVMMLIHMAVITERVADSMDEAYANKTTFVHAIARKVIFMIVLVFLGTRPQVNPVAMILGALGLKVGVYLQPFVHRIIMRSSETN